MTAQGLSLPEGSTDDWLAAIPAYQRTLVKNLLGADGDVTGAARMWLEASGPENSAPYGGTRVAQNTFFRHVLLEIQKFFCSDSDYQAERAELSAATTVTRTVWISSVATAISPHVGAATVVLLPAIALILSILSNAAKATTCDGIRDILESTEEN